MRYMVIALLALVAGAPQAVAQQSATATAAPSSLNVPQLFAGTCGWCHSDAGRSPGKGPQLMNSPRSDDYIRMRIKLGKQGAMPAFGGTFSDADINAIIKYIRSLKPEHG